MSNDILGTEKKDTSLTDLKNLAIEAGNVVAKAVHDKQVNKKVAIEVTDRMNHIETGVDALIAKLKDKKAAATVKPTAPAMSICITATPQQASPAPQLLRL